MAKKKVSKREMGKWKTELRRQKEKLVKLRKQCLRIEGSIKWNEGRLKRIQQFIDLHEVETKRKKRKK